MTEQTEKTNKAKRYTEEEKASILKQKEEDGLTVEQAATKFGVSKGSITGWMQKNKPVKEKKEKKEKEVPTNNVSISKDKILELILLTKKDKIIEMFLAGEL